MNILLLFAAAAFAYAGVALLLSWVFSESRPLPTVELYERLERSVAAV